MGGTTGLEPDFCYGCIDPLATNFDPDATIDDGSCEYMVEVSLGSYDQSAGTVELVMNNPVDVAGFQIEISNLNLIGAAGGTAEENGFTVSTNENGMVLGFSFSGSVIPIGEAVLTIVSFDSYIDLMSEICITSAIISGVGGYDIPAEAVGDCIMIEQISGCMDPTACNYNPDANIDDESCVFPVGCNDWCEGDPGEPLEEDCTGECGGEAFVDVCGYCVGGLTGLEPYFADLGCGCEMPGPEEYCYDWDNDGLGEIGSWTTFCIEIGVETPNTIYELLPEGWVLDCSDEAPYGEVNIAFGEPAWGEEFGSVDIYYTSDVDIYGFQFLLTDLDLIDGVSPLEDWTIEVNPENGLVLGISFTGGVYPPAEMGLLATVNYVFGPTVTSCIDEVVVSGEPGYVPAVTVGDCIEVVEPPMDCWGDYFGEAFLDDCGVCSGGNSGHEANSDQDCAGVCFGEAVIDDCGECTGGTTGLEFNFAMDCAGVCYGEAFENECGCVGGTTGLEPDWCYGCIDPNADNYDPDATIDDGSCEYTLPEFTDIGLIQSVDMDMWMPVDGSLMDGFDLMLDPISEYNYLNLADWTTTNIDLAEGMNGFYITGFADGFFEYWADKGVVEGADGWQAVAWEIINGNAPTFYIAVDGDGMLWLADGLLYQIGGDGTDLLRINTDYPEGSYSYEGSLLGYHGVPSDMISVGMTVTQGVYDCAGVLNGEAFLDDCGVCSGGTSGHEANSDQDCAGVCFGEAFIDDCGVCSGGTSGHEANSDQDCAGVCFGEAFENECGCVGGTTGLEPDWCYGCIDPNADNFNPDAIIDDGSCEYTLPEFTDIGLIQSVDMDMWMPVDGSLMDGFDLMLDPISEYNYLNLADWTTTNIDLAEGMNGFYITGFADGFFEYWADKGVVEGADGWQAVAWEIINGNAPTFYIAVDGDGMLWLADGLLYQIGGDGTDLLRINTDYPEGSYSYEGSLLGYHGVPSDMISVGMTVTQGVYDCAGVLNGEAFLDDCGVCSEGTTGHEANSDQDCMGVCFGEAFIDDCGICSGGTSGHEANSDQDCAGVCFGEAFIDDCGVCSGGTTGHEANSDQDCMGVCFGEAFIDDCGICSEGTSGHEANSDQDCAGVCFGEAFLDDCGVCSGGTTGHEANSDLDCMDVCFGEAFIDDCGLCSEGTSGHEANSDMDCAGVCFGEAYESEHCGCVGGTTGLDDEYCYGCTDPDALNFDEFATWNDGSCIYYETQDFDLHAGSNLISLWVTPPDPSISTVFAPLVGYTEGIIGEGVAAMPHPFIPGQWIGSLAEVDAHDGYWVTVIEDMLFSVDGDETDPELMYNIHDGANLISYPYNIAQDVEIAIPSESIGYFTGIIGEGVAAIPHPVIPGTWIGSLSAFEPGSGYWVIVTADFEYQWNIPSLAKTEPVAETSLDPVPVGFEFVQSTRQSFYFVGDIELSSGIIDYTDWIIAYNGDVVVGARQWAGELTDIPVMGSDGSAGTDGYCDSGDIPVFRVLTADGELHELAGDYTCWDDNVITSVSHLTSVAPVPEEYSLYQAYPNPFNPATTIAYGLPTDTQVELTVYDMNGRMITELVSEFQSAGVYELDWNASGQASGVYFIRLTTSDFTKTQKVMLVK